MNWNLEGLKIKANYLGTYPVSGRVHLSRVKFGGLVSHHITLDAPLNVFGAIRESVIIDHAEVLSVSSN